MAARPSARLAAVQPKRLPHAATAGHVVAQVVQMVWAQRVRCSGNGRVKCCIKLSSGSGMEWRWRWKWKWKLKLKCTVWLVYCISCCVSFAISWCVVSFVLFHANAKPEINPKTELKPTIIHMPAIVSHIKEEAPA